VVLSEMSNYPTCFIITTYSSPCTFFYLLYWETTWWCGGPQAINKLHPCHGPDRVRQK